MRALVLFACIAGAGVDFPPYAPPAHQICPGATVFYREGTPRPAGTAGMLIACRIAHHIFLKPAPPANHPKGTNHGRNTRALS